MMPPVMPMSALMSALRGAGRSHLTASTVAARQVITGSHVLRVHDYNQVVRKTVPTGTAITSTMFHVGGHDWQIRCYPNGNDEEHRGYTSLFLTNPGYEARARFGLTVLGPAGKPTSCARAWEDEPWFCPLQGGYRAGWSDFVQNDDLDLVDDCLTVLCDVSVDALPLRAVEVPAAALPTAAAAPPFELAEAIWSKQPTDVTIHVGGETFAAHRWVLEARSPVLKADLQNTTSGELYIADMDAKVFKDLLHFIYTDGALPAKHQLEARTMAERLLAAADRYGLEKLKLACEKTLCGHLDMGSVAATLELAERHGCAVLKEACMEFLSCPGSLADPTAAAQPSSDPADVIWSKQPTDVTVHAGGKTFAAHRRVLEAGSPVFKAELQNTSELRIADMDAEVFDALYEFLYTDGALTEKFQLEVPTMAEGLLVAADRYGLEKLKMACGEALCAHVDMSSVGAMLALAVRHGCAGLKEACVEFLSCPDNLRSFMATDGFERLKTECRSAAVEIVVKKMQL